MVDAKPIDAGANLVACLDFGVFRRQGVEEGAVAAAEVADADRAVLVANHFEVLAGQKLVRYAHVTFTADHEAARWDLELLADERPLQTDQNRAAPRFRLDGSRADL